MTRPTEHDIAAQADPLLLDPAEAAQAVDIYEPLAVGAHETPHEAEPARGLGGRLAGLSLGRQVAVLAVWPFFQQLLGFLVSFVDTAIAGRLSVEATNAIAIAAYFGWFLFLMTSAVGSGGAALIARAIGARHRSLANAGLGQSVLLALVWSLLMGGLVFVGADFIAVLASLEPASAALCSQYLRIIAVAAPATAVLAIGVACLSAAGDTRTPFLAMLVFNLFNIIASVFLAVSPWTVTLGGWAIRVPSLGWGVAGIAWGTALSTALGAVLILAALLRRSAPVRLRWMRLRPHLHTIKRIVKVALPSLGEGLGHWTANFLVLMVIGWIAVALGESAYQGAHIVAIRIESLSFLPAMAMATAAATLTGQYLGAGDAATARKAAVTCWLTASIPMTLLGATFIAFPLWWVSWVTSQSEHLALSPELVRICGGVQFFFGSAIVLGGAMRGAGDTLRPMILTNVMTWGVRLPAVLIVGLWLGYGLVGVWFALCSELLLRGVVFMAVFFRGRWARVQV